MILAKAPMRVSFFGGGSDIPAHYEQWGGDCVSMAIDKYVYVAVNKTPHNHIKVSYARQETVTNVDDIQNEIVRNALKYFGIQSNIEINSFADIPTMGTGLGGSSAFTCALVSALYEYTGLGSDLNVRSAYHIADLACHIEINMCGWKIGKQDQYASAFGGMNHLHFRKEGRVAVNRIDSNYIDQYMILIPTNTQRHASEILEKVDFNDTTYYIRELAHVAELNASYLPRLDTYGEVLNECWKLKKQMSIGITNPHIDAVYDTCMRNGAAGCKLLGAGGGGYMLALTSKKDYIRQVFPDRVCLDVKIANEGAKVVYRD